MAKIYEVSNCFTTGICIVTLQAMLTSQGRYGSPYGLPFPTMGSLGITSKLGKKCSGGYSHNPQWW